ncbi:MAG TPA: hypothetical protein VJH97_05385 [Candidatus Nanoarchaeia archaeon]|nr:hypothetical protein [Candidatus Nanoarchaeia archaeon]
MGIISDFRNRQKARSVIGQIVEANTGEDCDFLASRITEEMGAIGVPVRRRSVITDPPCRELGHVNLKNQYEHVVVEVGGRIFDPGYTERALKPDRYLEAAYRPQPGVKVVWSD